MAIPVLTLDLSLDRDHYPPVVWSGYLVHQVLYIWPKLQYGWRQDTSSLTYSRQILFGTFLNTSFVAVYSPSALELKTVLLMSSRVDSGDPFVSIDIRDKCRAELCLR